LEFEASRPGLHEHAFAGEPLGGAARQAEEIRELSKAEIVAHGSGFFADEHRGEGEPPW
jgi:hypothetical protein